MPYWNTTSSLSATSSIQVLNDSVGIGLSFSNTGGPSLDHRLHVHYGTGTYGVLIEGGGAIAENIPLRLWDTGTGASNINILEFAHATSSSPKLYVPGARLRSVNPVSGAVTGANLIIETSSLSNPTTTTWNTNQLYLRNDGNVGLNTGVPTSYLTINTPGGSTYNGGSVGEHAIIFGSQSTGSMIAFMGTDDTLAATYLQSSIRGGAAAPILLNAQGGNIGIGVTSPGAKLHAVTNVSTIPLIIASGSTTVDLVRITQTGTGNAFVVEDSTNPDSTAFAISNAGDVGIGVATNTSYKLYAFSTTQTAILGQSGTIGVIGSGNNIGVQGDGVNGVYGIGMSDTSAIGVYGIAADNGSPTSLSEFYGGKFVAAVGTGKNHSLLLQDGTEGINKVLVSADANGSANWSSTINVTGIIASASTTTDLVRITQVGTGNALVVEDSTNPDLTPFIVTAAGNVGVGTASPSTGLHVFSTTSGAFRLVDGTQQNGYVLTSDANGVATWQVSSGGPGGTNVTTPGNNRIVTSDGTSTGLVGEANLNFDGSFLGLTGSFKMTGTFSGNNTNFVQSELITQTVLLYMSNNT